MIIKKSVASPGDISVVIITMKYYRFKKHVLAHHPKEILDLDEFLKLRTEVVKEMDPGLQEDGDELPPGMDLPPGEEGIGGKVILAVMRRGDYRCPF